MLGADRAGSKILRYRGRSRSEPDACNPTRNAKHLADPPAQARERQRHERFHASFVDVLFGEAGTLR